MIMKDPLDRLSAIFVAMIFLGGILIGVGLLGDAIAVGLMLTRH